LATYFFDSSALAKRYHPEEGSAKVEAMSLADHFKADVAAGTIDVFAISVFDYGRAEDLVSRHGFGSRLRSLDALQLGVALDLRDQGLGNTIVAADVILGEVAASEGLSVLNLKD
jgi:hypothetical protein